MSTTLAQVGSHVLWIAPLVQLVAVLLAATAAYLYGVRKHRIERETEYRNRQMQEFYGPIAGLRKMIDAKYKLQFDLSAAAVEGWRERVGRMSFAQQLRADWNEEHAPFMRQIQANNTQFREVILPAYQRMRDLFTDKYWLVDHDTREYYRDFLIFVDHWERWLAGTMPREVAERLPNNAERLSDFYKHIEARLTDLQSAIGSDIGLRDMV